MFTSSQFVALCVAIVALSNGVCAEKEAAQTFLHHGMGTYSNAGQYGVGQGAGYGNVEYGNVEYGNTGYGGVVGLLDGQGTANGGVGALLDGQGTANGPVGALLEGQGTANGPVGALLDLRGTGFGGAGTGDGREVVDIVGIDRTVDAGRTSGVRTDVRSTASVGGGPSGGANDGDEGHTATVGGTVDADKTASVSADVGRAPASTDGATTTTKGYTTKSTSRNDGAKANASASTTDAHTMTAGTGATTQKVYRKLRSE